MSPSTSDRGFSVLTYHVKSIIVTMVLTANAFRSIGNVSCSVEFNAGPSGFHVDTSSRVGHDFCHCVVSRRSKPRRCCASDDLSEGHENWGLWFGSGHISCHFQNCRQIQWFHTTWSLSGGIGAGAIQSTRPGIYWYLDTIVRSATIAIGYRLVGFMWRSCWCLSRL